MILKREILEQLSSQLSLPYTGIEQDWDIEMANSNRINEFIKFYKRSNLSNDQKLATMSLILSSYDDLLNEKGLDVDAKWKEIRVVLESEKVIFADLIDYWSLDDELEGNDIFKITPLIREYKATSLG